MTLTLKEYQEGALKTAQYPEKHKITYPMVSLAGEVGELSNKWQKHLRGDPNPPSIEDMGYELGDVLWYVAVLAHDLGVSLEDVAQRNLDKLASRAERGQIKGSGDNR